VDIALRSIFVFFFIYLVTRVVGRRELSTLEPFDLLLLIVVGDAMQQGLTQDDYSVTGGLIVILTFAVLQVGISYASFRFPRLRPVLEGEPLVLLENGRPIDRNLRRERLTVEELASAARQHEIAHLEDVQWAVLETSGEISFIKKS
jgi:uncharacterized membrane protein YcaP (DUF421 family)